jgi:hypothetical protein
MCIRKAIQLSIVTMVATLLVGNFALAANPTSWTGYVIDRLCAATQRNSTNPLNFAKGHGKDCALMPACKKAGFTLLVDGKWLDLDPKGDQIVLNMLNVTKQGSGLHVRVDGQLKGNVIQVSKITEVQ